MSNSMVTMRYLDTQDGQVQVKWWKHSQMLLIYNVRMSQASGDQGGLDDPKCVRQFTDLCRDLLSLSKYAIEEVRLVGIVDDPELLDLEHTILLKKRYLQSIVDPVPIPFINRTKWFERTMRENQEQRHNVLQEIHKLDDERGRRNTVWSLLSKFGWEKLTDTEYRLCNISKVDNVSRL